MKLRNPIVEAELKSMGLPDVTFPEPSPISFAQHAEDLVVDGLLSARYPDQRPKSWTYLDVGANHPIHGSNTYLLYKKGASGVVIEPNSAFNRLFEKCRPRDKFILAGAKFDDRDVATFYNVENDALSSFSEVFHQNWKEAGGKGANLLSSIEIPLVDLTSIISDNFEKRLNVVSLDVEGYEFEVLQRFNFELCRPDIFVIEYVSPTHGSIRNTLVKMMNGNDYRLVFCGRVNLIFVNEIE